MVSDPCPCGSTHAIVSCCLPFIEGKRHPQTTEELLRSRYTAFTRGDVDYIINTHHGRTRDQISREEIEKWSRESTWKGLKILESEGGKAADASGTIAFCAEYETGGKKHEHFEQSLFEKEDGKWKFVDAQALKSGPVKRTEPKVGRNDPCPCGSGKKHKKCCG